MIETRAAHQRFALVTETYAPQINGVANTLGRLSDGLLLRQHAVQLIRPAQAGEAMGSESRGALSELRVRGLPIPGYPELQWGLPASGKLQRLWRHARPGAVYLATEGPLGWSALQVARRMGIPVISGFHTNFQQYSDHYGLSLLHKPMMNYLRWFHSRTQLTLTASPSQQRARLRAGLHNLALLGRGVDCAFDLAAAHQHIRDRFSGCLAAEGHERLFIDNLDWLIRDAEGRRSIRMHARHRACQLGWGEVVQRFEGYLLKAANRPPAALPALQGK